MKKYAIYLTLIIVFALTIVGCSPAKTGGDQMGSGTMSEPPADSNMDNEATPTKAINPTMGTDEADEEIMATPEASEEMEGQDSDTMENSPGWFAVDFQDAATNETFSIEDYKGKVILVETMAQWCTNCFHQQGEVRQLHESLGERDDFVSIGLDIDTNETLDALKTYVAKNGFNWKYSVASPEVTREIANLYGEQFLNPPSTPMLVIDRKGNAHPLPFGIKSAEDLEEMLKPFLDETM